MRMRCLIAILAVTAAAWPQRGAPAQTYPSRPIVMVVPYAAGGTFDVMGRIIAVRMSELLGQQIVVENTTGAGGIIGVNRVINAAPDGYTHPARLDRHARLQPERSTKSAATTPSTISRRSRCSPSSRWCSKPARTFPPTPSRSSSRC